MSTAGPKTLVVVSWVLVGICVPSLRRWVGMSSTSVFSSPLLDLFLGLGLDVELGLEHGTGSLGCLVCWLPVTLKIEIVV